MPRIGPSYLQLYVSGKVLLNREYTYGGYQTMKPKPTDKKALSFSPILSQVIRKSLLIYLGSVVILLVICLVLGFQTLDNIGKGFIYGSLCLILFGILTLFGNTVPAQLSKLSLPKYSPPSTEPHKESEIDESVTNNRGKVLFLTSSICGALLFVTGLILRMF
jgi:hypothetical protein